MKDTTITVTDTWTDPIPLNKGDNVSVSVKGTFTGTIKVQRWLQEYEADLPDTPAEAAKHIGTIQEYTDTTESVDISAGAYFYRIGTDATFSGTAYVHIQ